jgi:hypothetical protein
MISKDVFSQEVHIPIFGFGAKTFPNSSEVANIFPVSQNMTNPFIRNKEDTLNHYYAKCLQKIKLDLPVKITPTLMLMKSLGVMVREKQDKAYKSGDTIV